MDRDARSLSLWDALRFQLYVGLPGFLLGVVVPNRWFLSRFARWHLGRASHRFIGALRTRYASDLLWLWFPFRRTLLVLSSAAIDGVLASPDNAPDPWLKKRAISRFAPGALVATGDAGKGDRRAFNTGALDLGHLHRDAGVFAGVAASASRRLVDGASDALRSRDFAALGTTISQEIILGAGQRDDALADGLARALRGANVLWRNRAAFADVRARLDGWLRGAAAAPPRPCLAHAAARARADGRTSPATCVTSQVTFWCFVLKDAVELHVPRTLALIAAHPTVQAKVRAEIRDAGELTPQAIDGLRYLEACIVEGLRLWTPVPLLLRRATRPCVVGNTTVEEGQQLLVHAGFHHRDPKTFGRFADAFAPDEAVAGALLPVYVFSAHGRSCAGESLVRFVLKCTLATMLARHRFELASPAIEPGRIPHLVDHFAIALRPVASAPATVPP